MQDADRRPASRRMLLITIAMVLVIVCGLALFFVYGDSTEPLLPSITNTGVNE